jgi:hypothetical protein
MSTLTIHPLITHKLLAKVHLLLFCLRSGLFPNVHSVTTRIIQLLLVSPILATRTTHHDPCFIFLTINLPSDLWKSRCSTWHLIGIFIMKLTLDQLGKNSWSSYGTWGKICVHKSPWMILSVMSVFTITACFFNIITPTKLSSSERY